MTLSNSTLFCCYRHYPCLECFYYLKLNFLKKKKIFIYLFMAVLDLHRFAGLSPVAVSRGYFLLWCKALELVGSVVVVLELSPLWHVGPFQTQDRTCVPCIGRWIVNHGATGKSPVDIPLLVSTHLARVRSMQ